MSLTLPNPPPFKPGTAEYINNALVQGVSASALTNAFAGTVGVLDSIAELRALAAGTLGFGFINLLGYYADGDGGGGIVYYNPGDTTTADNGGTVFVDAAQRRWYRQDTSRDMRGELWGAIANGTTQDFWYPIQSALNYMNSVGGGTVRLAPGTYYISQTLVMFTHCQLIGEGHGETVIVGTPGTTNDLLQTFAFASLTGSNTAGGPYQWKIQGITFNANKAARTGNGRCLAIYGYDYVLEDCTFEFAPGVGVYSEWATSGGVPVSAGGDGMEARIENCKFFGNGGDGLHFLGPHDSTILNTLSFLNIGYGYYFNATATNSGSGNLITAHAYANSQHGVYINTGVNMSQVQSESNLSSSGGFLLDTSGFTVGADLTAYSNSGFGMQVNGGLSAMSNLFFHANGTNGLALIGSGNIFSNVLSNNNGQDGIVSTSTGTSTVISGALVQSNGSFGIALSGSDMAVTGILAEFNAGGGVTLANGIGSIRLEGEVNSNGTGTVQVPLGTMGTGCSIDLIIFTQAGETAWTGSVGANFVKITAQGGGTNTSINNAPGVTNASNANAGAIGEAVIVQGTGVGQSNGSPANVTSMTLTPGDWDVTGMIDVAPTGATITNVAGSISLTSSTLGPFTQGIIYSGSTTGQVAQALPTIRLNVSVATAVYLVSETNFSAGTCNASGQLFARRAR
jgi:hypothetical protein